MKFVSIIERVGSYIAFQFDSHNRDMVCNGDQIWSDSNRVEVYESVDKDVIDDLIDQVENKQAFKGALRRMELI